MLTISILFKVALFQILVLPRFEMYKGFQTQCSLGCLSRATFWIILVCVPLKNEALQKTGAVLFGGNVSKHLQIPFFKQHTFLVERNSMQWLVMLQLLLLAPWHPGGISSQFWRRRMEKENDCFLDTWKRSWVSTKFPSTMGSQIPKAHVRLSGTVFIFGKWLRREEEDHIIW